MTIKPSVYVLGTKPPVLPPDPGAGRWNSIPRTTSMIVLKAILTGRVEGVPGAVLTVFAPLFVGGLFVGGSALQGAASYFGGDDAVIWPAAAASLGCLALNVGLLRYLRYIERANRR